jgi:hypothetical protein
MASSELPRVVTVILGAGASYDCGCTTPTRPPLGCQLLDELARTSDFYVPIAAAYGEVFRRDFEEGFALVEQDTEFSDLDFLRGMGRYFARFRIDANCRYLRLLAGLSNSFERVVVVTTNYDLLLELSLCALDRRWDYTFNPGAPAKVTLLKIHGSCNFVPQLPDFYRHAMVSKPVNVSLDFPIRVILDMEELEQTYAKSGLDFPAMALYERNKRTPVCATFVKQLQRGYEAVIRQSDLVIVSGLRFLNHDEHLWGPFRDYQGKLWVADPALGTTVPQVPLHPAAHITLFREGFSSFVGRITNARG